MGNDLNFDELDKAVNNYMQKSPAVDDTSAQVPVSSSFSPPITNPSPHTSTPEPSKEVSTPLVDTSAIASSAEPATQPRIQLQTRQSLAGRRASRTFHDIIPPRHSPATPVAIIAPPSASADVLPAMPAPTGAPPIISPPTPTPTPEPDVTPASDPLPPETQIDAPTPEASPAHEATPSLVAPSATSDEQPESVDADLDALQKEVPKILSQETSDTADMPVSDTPLTPPTPSATQVDSSVGIPTGDSLAHQQIDFADDAKDAPVTTGLLNTGELHAALPSHVAATPAQLDAESGNEPPLQVFDTKEYHTPITGGGVPSTGQKGSREKMWEWIIIVLLVIIALVGGVVAYTMVVKG